MMAPGSRVRSARTERFARVDPIPRTAQAYLAIKEEILTNRLRAGDAVPMDRFVRELKLSRTPVREAILRLAREGFIEVRPRMGTFVSHLDLRQIQELYEVRSMLEGRAARLAAARVEPAHLAQVEQRLNSQKTEGKLDCTALSEAGQEVHKLIVSSCGNRVLSQMILSLHDHFARFRNLSLQIPEKLLSSHREHRRIVDALKRRDGEAAERLVQEHFDHAAKYLLQSLLQPSSDPASPRLTVSAR
ncbi:MAG: GntR family transcriptional regulator [Bryobacteraceae bacterium]